METGYLKNSLIHSLEQLCLSFLYRKTHFKVWYGYVPPNGTVALKLKEGIDHLDIMARP